MQKSLWSEEELNKKPYCCEIKISTMTVREASGPKCSNPQAIADMFTGIENMAQEGFFVVTMNNKNEAIDMRMITLGTINATLVHPREVFRPAIADCAVSIALVHNHPSGNPEPSAEDKAITKKLCEAGGIIGIKVIDHVIVGSNGIYSFAEHGIL